MREFSEVPQMMYAVASEKDVDFLTEIGRKHEDSPKGVVCVLKKNEIPGLRKIFP